MYDELIRILERCELSEKFIMGVIGIGAATGLLMSIERNEPEMRDPYIDLMSEVDQYILAHSN